VELPEDGVRQTDSSDLWLYLLFTSKDAFVGVMHEQCNYVIIDTLTAYSKFVADRSGHLEQRVPRVGHKSNRGETEHGADLAVVFWQLWTQHVEHRGAHGMTNVKDLVGSCCFKDVVNHCRQILRSHLVPAAGRHTKYVQGVEVHNWRSVIEVMSASWCLFLFCLLS